MYESEGYLPHSSSVTAYAVPPSPRGKVLGCSAIPSPGGGYDAQLTEYRTEPIIEGTDTANLHYQLPIIKKILPKNREDLFEIGISP